ncbi:MAG: hypothetical protein USCGTAYLOR_01026 [Chromatiales bacterium USCg_Taylor]|nr:MAG: hypothetical protein USCGTAYLOR_01026 [Chromatiales bacterium USCg_Taylor]
MGGNAYAKKQFYVREKKGSARMRPIKCMHVIAAFNCG